MSYVVQLEDGRSIRMHVDHLRLRFSERRTTEDTTLIDSPSGVRVNSEQVHSRSSEEPESARPGVTSSANEEIEVDAEPGQRQESVPKHNSQGLRRSSCTDKPPDRLLKLGGERCHVLFRNRP